ncbi:rubrerythrin-related protein [Candidatus Scalindua japonica]|uniref:Rubrerythrin-related protein n=1 Tax=Candidatus Scalindua japonica TaxID=1284222 RepID=A0A286TZR0_9BACT|nr:ferritin family protein [Candidatus Scalindua japonica]GAX61389.1 rubrerythrin-related protein [Candidatus Scalindua japonica]
MNNQIEISGKRIKELEKVIEVLIVAIPREEVAYEFYHDLAKSIKHEGTRRMFIKVANQKLSHKGMLEMELKKLQQEIDKLKSTGK